VKVVKAVAAETKVPLAIYAPLATIIFPVKIARF
jgi:hypothetical protein